MDVHSPKNGMYRYWSIANRFSHWNHHWNNQFFRFQVLKVSPCWQVQWIGKKTINWNNHLGKKEEQLLDTNQNKKLTCHPKAFLGVTCWKHLGKKSKKQLNWNTQNAPSDHRWYPPIVKRGKGNSCSPRLMTAEASHYICFQIVLLHLMTTMKFEITRG